MLRCINDYLFRIILDTKYINFTSLVILCNIIFSALAYTLWYRLTLKSYKYSYLYGQFYVNILFTLFMIISFGIYVYKRKYSNDPFKYRFLNKSILSIYFKFALLETVVGYLAILPVFYFSPVFLILFGQLSLIMNHIGAYFYFGRRYTNSQIYSVIIVLFAVVITTITESTKSNNTIQTINISCNDESNSTINHQQTDYYDDITNNNNNNISLSSLQPLETPITLNIYYYILLAIMLILIRVIATFSSLYKEKKYKELSLDAIETITIVSIIEIPMSIFVFVFLLVPLPPPAIHIPFNQFGQYIINGTQLLFINEDKEILIVMSLFLILSAMSSMMEFTITQKLNSTVNVIVGVSTLSFSVIFINIQWIAGSAYHSINFYEYISLALIITALIHYRIETPDEDKQIIDRNSKETYFSSVSSLFNGTVNIPLNTIGKQEFYSVSNNTNFDTDDDDSNELVHVQNINYDDDNDDKNLETTKSLNESEQQTKSDSDISSVGPKSENSSKTKKPIDTNEKNVIFLGGDDYDNDND